MEKCKNFADRFTEFFDHDLNNEEMTETQAHLRDCPGCDKIASDVGKIIKTLNHCQEICVSPSFDNVLRAQLNRHINENQKRKKIQLIFNIAATFALVFSFTWIYINNDWNKNSAPGYADLDNSQVGIVHGTENSDMVNYSTGQDIPGGFIKKDNWLGMTLEQVEKNKVVVTHVYDSNPAAIAGVKNNDTLLFCGGKEISNLDDFENVLKTVGSSSILELKLKRKDKLVQIQVPVQTRYYSE